MDDFMAMLAPAADGTPTLDQLSADVARIAAHLAVLAEREAIQRTRRSAAAGNVEIDSRFVRALIADRGRRSLWFVPDFRHPGWSLMLELYACRLEGRTIRVSDLTAATDVPATTALRWIDTLAAQKLAARRTVEGSARRTTVELTQSGADRMKGYLAAVLAPTITFVVT